MTSRRSIGWLAVLILSGMSAALRAQDQDCAENREPPLSVRKSVTDCLSVAVATYGYWCGTPVATACSPVVDAGKDAVPLLVAAIHDSDDERMIPTARWVLTRITGRPIPNTGNKLTDLEDVSRWWLANCSRSRSAWIVDALAGTDGQASRIALNEIRAIQDSSEVPRLIALLDGPDLLVSRMVLGVLWNVFHSPIAIERAAAMIRAGGPRSDAFVYQTGESKIDPLYPVLLGELRKASVGARLPDALIDVVGKLKLPEEVELLQAWDRDERITASKAALISTLTELLKGAYEPALLEHLRAGKPAERRVAAGALGKVGEPQRVLPALMLAIGANDVDGAAAGALWGLLSLSERGLSPEQLSRVATALLRALRDNATLEAPGVNRVISDVAFRYLRVTGRIATVPNLGWPADRATVLDRWGKWWDAQGVDQARTPP